MKKLLFFVLVPVFIILTGCGGYHSRQYSGPELDKSLISVITTDDQFVTLGGVDGKRIDMPTASNFSNAIIWGGRFPRTISVLPGQHSIWPCYQNPYEGGCAEGWINVETKAGQSYILKHERLEENKIKVIKFWIENQDGTEKTLHQKLLNL